MATTREILGLLSDNEIWDVSAIYDKLQGSKESLRSTLYFLKNSDHIQHVGRGKYKITDKGMLKYDAYEGTKLRVEEKEDV